MAKRTYLPTLYALAQTLCAYWARHRATAEQHVTPEVATALDDLADAACQVVSLLAVVLAPNEEQNPAP